MSYNLGNLPERREKKNSPYIFYGSNQILKINQIELVSSRNTGSKKAVLHMETKPVNEPDFTPIEGAEGRVGKIGCGVYMKTEAQKNEFFQKMLLIARSLGLEDEFTKISGDSFEEVVSKIEKVICGNKFARYTIFAEQYAKTDAKIGLRLLLPRWGFVESISIPENESKIIQFDENNPKHFTKIAKPEAEVGTLDDDGDLGLPF